MKNSVRLVNNLSAGFIIISVMSLMYVALMAMADPQKVMELVQVQIPNNDAYSSLRGVYGGVGLAISLFLLYLIKRYKDLALAFLSLLWGFYAISRLITIFIEGPLGDFGRQWIVIETLFFMIACVLFYLQFKQKSTGRFYS